LLLHKAGFFLHSQTVVRHCLCLSLRIDVIGDAWAAAASGRPLPLAMVAALSAYFSFRASSVHWQQVRLER
jgi:hypothetical protein